MGRVHRNQRVGNWKTPSARRQGRRRRTDQGAAELRRENREAPETAGTLLPANWGCQAEFKRNWRALSQPGPGLDRPAATPSAHAITGSATGRSSKKGRVRTLRSTPPAGSSPLGPAPPRGLCPAVPPSLRDPAYRASRPKGDTTSRRGSSGYRSRKQRKKQHPVRRPGPV